LPRASITPLGLARLLERLNPDRDRAAAEYERLRRTLIRFFSWRGTLEPDLCADETIDRLARRLEEGTVVDDVATYVRGIARMVMLERQRSPTPLPIETNDPSAQGSLDEPDNDVAECLESCLAALRADTRSLVLAYYEGERGSKIQNRRRLAQSLGLTEAALRSRVQRIRDRLEDCMQMCLSRRARRL
jgi:DNA-directed RNA polymerase specialized sigma24 family protein